MSQVDPCDGEVIRSIVGLKRKLGLQAPLPIALIQPAAARVPNGVAREPSIPGTRRQRLLQRPKAEAARLARQELQSAEGELLDARQSEKDAVQQVARLVEHEHYAIARAEAAAAAHMDAEAAVAAAFKASKDAARELRTGRIHVCFIDGCQQSFPHAAQLRRHQARAHKKRSRPRTLPLATDTDGVSKAVVNDGAGATNGEMV